MIRLRELREGKNISQKELGEIFNVAQNTISNWEKGSREPDASTLLKLADLFGVSVDYILGRTDIKKAPETIAAHHEGEEWTEEELEDIEKFKEFVRMRRQQNK